MSSSPNLLLLTYSEYFGRMGGLNGRILISEENWETLCGREWYASEVLGKYSEIYGAFGDTEFWKTKPIGYTEAALVCDILDVPLSEQIFEKWDPITDQFWAGPSRACIAGFDPISYVREG